MVLTEDGIIYSCGINEKGTVPVKGLELEEVTDKFTEIVFEEELNKLGKVNIHDLNNKFLDSTNYGWRQFFGRFNRTGQCFCLGQFEGIF